MGRVFLQNIIPYVRAGQIPGAYIVDKFGRNEDVDTSLETVWDHGGLYSYLSSPQTVWASSNNSADAGLTLFIEGLDENWNRATESVILDVTDPSVTAVETTTTFIRVYRMYNDGATDYTGVISVSSTSVLVAGDPTGTILAKITVENSLSHNQTLMCVYTVPAGKTAFLMDWTLSTPKNKDAVFYGFFRFFGGVFRVGRVKGLFQNEHNHVLWYQRMPEKTDLEIRAVSLGTNTAVNVAFTILVVPTEIVKDIIYENQ